MNDIGGDLGETDSAGVNALNQELSIFDALVKVLLRGGLQLLLQEEHDLFDVSAGDHLQGDTEAFSLDLHVWARQNLEDVHNKTVQYVREFLAEGINSVQNDEFDIVVGLLDKQLRESTSSG